MQTSLGGWLKKTTAPQQRLMTSPPPIKDYSVTPILPLHEANEAKTNATTANALSQANTASLHPSLTFVAPSQSLMPAFKRLNTLLLPIPYPASFYSELLSDPVANSISLFALYDDKLIGAIRCRILSPEHLSPSAPRHRNYPQQGDRVLYVSTLAVLSPFRSLGVATELLRRVGIVAREQYGIDRVGAHVWLANTEGRAWYAKRGFNEGPVLDEYYPRLAPKGAIVVTKDIGPAHDS